MLRWPAAPFLIASRRPVASLRSRQAHLDKPSGLRSTQVDVAAEAARVDARSKQFMQQTGFEPAQRRTLSDANWRVVPLLALGYGAALRALSSEFVAVVVVAFLLALWLVDRLNERFTAAMLLSAAGSLSSTAILFASITRAVLDESPSTMLGGGVGIACVWLASGWGLLQFEWLHFMSPPLCVAVERLVLLLAPLVVPALLAWVAVRSALVDIGSAPLLLALAMCAAHALCGESHQSVFKRPRQHELDHSDLAVTALDTFVQHATMVLLPLLVYCAVYKGVLADDVPLHLAQSLGLAALTNLYLGSRQLWGGRTLWYVRRTAQRPLALLAANSGAVVALWCFHYRVVIRGYGHVLPVHGAGAHVLSLSVLGSAAVGAALLGGLVPGDAGTLQLMATVLFSVGALVVASVTRMSWWVFPMPLVAAVLLVDFRFSLRLRSYLGAVAATAVCVWWFAFHTLWFMRIACEEIDSCVAEQQLLAFALVVAFALSSALLGAVLTQAPATQAVLVAHAVAYTWVERLFVAAGETALSDHFFPQWLSVVGAVGGAAFVLQLERAGRVGPLAAWLAVSIHASRCALALNGSWSTLFGALFLCGAVLRLWLFRAAPPKGADYWTLRSSLEHAGAIAAACAGALPTVISPLLALSLYDGDGSPHWSVLLGAAVLTCSVALWPLSLHRTPGATTAVRSGLLVLAVAGLLLLAAEPNTGAFALLTSSAAGGGVLHTPFAMVLLLALLLALPTSALGLARSASLRHGYSALLGLVATVVIDGGYLPPVSDTGNALAGYALFVLLSNALGLFFAAALSVIWPPATRGGLLRAEVFFALHAALVGASWFVAKAAFSVHGHAPPRGDDRLASVFVVLAGLLSFTALLFAAMVRLVSGGDAEDGGEAAADARKSIVPLAAPRRVATSSDERRLLVGGNAATALAYALAIWLSVAAFDGTSWAAFTLSPMLLLMGDDGALWRPRSALASIVSGVALALIAMSSYTIAVHAAGQWSADDATLGGVAFFAGRHLVMLGCCVPSLHGLARSFFRAAQAAATRDDATNVLFTVPLNILPLFFAHVRGVQLLGGVCIIAGLAVFAASESFAPWLRRLVK